MRFDITDRGVPASFDTLVRVANLAVIGFGGVGLVAAVIGVFSVASVLPFGSIATFALWRVDRIPGDRVGQVGSVGRLVSVAVVAFVTLNAAYSLTHRSEHVEINRDPGFYVNAAKWIVEDGSLVVEAEVGPFADHDGLGYETPGMPSPERGVLNFQGNHLLPVLMAIGGSLGGDAALFAVPVGLGALALLTIYGFLASRTSAVAAAVGTVALGGSVLWVAFARDAYTEVPSLSLVAFALSRLPASGGPPTRAAAIHIGVALGALAALRIDAPLLLLLWPVLVGSWWVRHDRRAAARATTGLLVGFVPLFAIAMVDLFVRSREYVADLAARTAALWSALVAVCIVVALVAIVPALRARFVAIGTWWAAHRSIRVLAATSVAAGLVGLWFVRPLIETVHGPAQRDVAAMQERLGLPVEITRKYSEYSFEWQSWYLGPALVAISIVGIGVVVAQRDVARRFAPLLLVAAPASLLYLYRPNIFPDHTWVMRRFLTTLTLALVAGAAIGLDAGLRWRGRRPWLVRAVVACLAMLTVALPLHGTRPVRAAADQAGYLGVVRDACTQLGPNAAVLVMRDDADALYKRLPGALRGWCDVPVAIAGKSLTPSVRRALEAEWAALDVDLFLIGVDDNQLADVCAGPTTPFRAENRFLLEQTLTEIPDGYSTQSLDFVIARSSECARRTGETPSPPSHLVPTGRVTVSSATPASTR
jgi:hypothetical protein